MIELPNGTPLNAVKKNGVWAVIDPPGEAAGTYVIEVFNTTNSDGARVVVQRITAMETMITTLVTHTTTGVSESGTGASAAIAAIDDYAGDLTVQAALEDLFARVTVLEGL